MNDDSTLTGRVRRYAQTTAAVGGLAARLAGQRYLGMSLDRGQHAAELKAALGGMKGPLMKVAQLLATIPEALPKEYAAELSQLQSNAPPMGWNFVRRRMAAELGPDWQKKFRSFGHEAAAAASLGQVHRAVSPDGQDLAVKLQYPDMASAVEADLAQLRLIFSIYARYDNAIKTDEIHAEVGARLREELDYGLEMKHMRLYRMMLAEQPMVTIPEPVPELSSKRLLTMTWLEGMPILDMVERSQDERNTLALNMFHAWYVPFYYFGAIHGDPHLGNYSVRPDLGVNLLDFGCVRIFAPRFVQGVIDLYHALERGDEALAVHAYESWGFGNLSREVIDALNQWARFIYGPLLEDKPRRIQEMENMVGREVAERVHADLKRLGGVKPPRAFVFMDRAALGLGSVFTHLRAEVNWHRIFKAMIEDFDANAMSQRQAAMLAACGLPPAGED